MWVGCQLQIHVRQVQLYPHNAVANPTRPKVRTAWATGRVGHFGQRVLWTLQPNHRNMRCARVCRRSFPWSVNPHGNVSFWLQDQSAHKKGLVFVLRSHSKLLLLLLLPH